jgi:hypothetical protein
MQYGQENTWIEDLSELYDYPSFSSEQELKDLLKLKVASIFLSRRMILVPVMYQILTNMMDFLLMLLVSDYQENWTNAAKHMLMIF